MIGTYQSKRQIAHYPDFGIRDYLTLTLTAAEARNGDRKAQQAPAVTYRRVNKEDGHV
ncbi:hypothetical protein [Paenibacillus sp. LHD-38]|uniref:hypothetical protein n=1 Tax=Paenibacillus sp. LHD-38 TaxID=3072143 RepID=UPI00281076CF|nr:hypothetical protein [Paenibacillus sp. LHD-38]MDQ8739112.1 hypothetical protein [Paenibacillus sp. LHD-38]